MEINNPIIRTALKGCLAGMQEVRKHQLFGVPLAEVKTDQTLLTIADTASEAKIKSTFTEVPDISFWSEEGQRFGSGRYDVLVDPLDGTNIFVSGGMSSTVIIGIHDRPKRSLVGCVIGEPISGRVWFATDKEPTQLSIFTHGDVQALIKSHSVRVWNGPLDKGNIFIDVSHGFKSYGRQILTDAGNAALYASLNRRTKILMPGSNGLMQALVANGSERMAGSITTAIGGPWDICGALLVRQAGGYAVGFVKTDISLETANPLSVFGLDALVCGNTKETVKELAKAFLAAAMVA